MTALPGQAIYHEDELRIVIDAQIVLAMFLTRRGRGEVFSSKRFLLRFLIEAKFRWLWTADMIADYAKGAKAIQADQRLMRLFVFDQSGFQLLLDMLDASLPVTVSTDTLGDVRRRIRQAPRAAERDLEDAVYLACAVDGNAHLWASEDSDLRSLGSNYQDVRIVDWQELQDELRKRGLTL